MHVFIVYSVNMTSALLACMYTFINYSRARRGVWGLCIWVRWFVCLSVRVRNSKTIGLIDLIFLQDKEDSSPLRDRTRITTTSNVRYDEKKCLMKPEGLPSLIVLFIIKSLHYLLNFKKLRKR